MQRCRALFLSIAVLLLGTLGVQAQEKVVESSAARVPEWIGKTEKGYLTSSASAPSLNTAKEMAFSDIRSQIANAVATNVVSVSETYVSSERQNEQESYYRGYYSHVRSSAASLPFISGISLSDDAESYWEKIYVKKEKRYYWSYHLRYSFPRHRLDRMIEEYKALDATMWQKYLDMRQEYDTFVDIDRIPAAVNELESLSSWFEDGYRKSAVLALKESFSSACSAISLVPVSNEPECFVYRLLFNGRSLQYSKRPSLKSEYATEIEWTPSEDRTYTVRYNCEEVREYDRKEIILTYRFGTRTLKYTVEFRLK